VLSLDEVSQTLWRQRQLLDLLLCKLEVEQLVLASGKPRWLPTVTREVEYVLAELKQVDLLRAMLIDSVAAEYGLEPGATLRQLGEAVPSPWDGLLEQHRLAFLSLSEELAAVARTNRELLAKGAATVREALDRLCDTAPQPPPDTYSAAGVAAAGSAGARFVDGRL
jgi:flagellar FlgN protein